MPAAIFVAPYFLEATLRFVEAVSNLEDVRLGLVSTDPEDRLPPAIRSQLAAHWRVSDCLDPVQTEQAVRGLATRLGRPDVLLGTLEELQVPLAEVRERTGIPGLGVEAAKNFRDKARMKSVLAAAGLPCARHRLAADPEAAFAFAREVGYPVVVKPQAGAGARNTFRVDSDDRLRAYVAEIPPSSERPVMLEEFVTGEEHSFDAVVIDGRAVWHSISRYYPSPLEVLREPWIQWCVLLPRHVDGPEYEAIRREGPASLAALGLRTGLAHMEWFRRPDGSVAISEVGARPPGAQFTTLMSYAHDTDMYRAWARLMVYGTFDPPARRYAVGCAYLRGQGTGRVRAVHGLADAAREVGDLVIESRLPRPGQSPSGSYEGDGYAILRHPETAVVEEGLLRLVSRMRVELG
ncbi:MAG: ATP-grasp domain-containing protein [Candidatus Eiseniibacteriota bacterium]